MLPKVGIGRRCGAIQANINRYRALMSDELYEELLALGKELAGVKICHLNSTAAGGGVAELFSRGSETSFSGKVSSPALCGS